MEIDFAKLLISMIHEMDFKTSTTYPLSCMILHLWRDSRVTIWHCDVLRTPVETVDIGLIRDEDNVAAPRRGPRVELQSKNENLVDMVELSQAAHLATQGLLRPPWPSPPMELVEHQIPPGLLHCLQHWSR